MIKHVHAPGITRCEPRLELDRLIFAHRVASKDRRAILIDRRRRVFVIGDDVKPILPVDGEAGENILASCDITARGNEAGELSLWKIDAIHITAETKRIKRLSGTIGSDSRDAIGH